MPAPAPDAGARQVPPAAVFEFDIPSQPLAAALHRYASVTGRPALFRSELVAGRRSHAVKGAYTPQAALQHLLQGTGLVARTAPGGQPDAFVLAAVRTAPPAGAARPRLDFDYGALVQARVWKTLCADARTAPGDYRSLLRFWVDGSGRVRRARLLASTGQAERDQALVEVLNDVRIERSPPPDMKQPLTLIILPNEPGRGRRCDSEVS